MKKAHLFFPENDLALGRNLDNYTAPGAAVKLRTAGYTLPMWFMEPDDCFIAQGVNHTWLEGMRKRFGMEAQVYNRRPEQWDPTPWGWSRAARQFFKATGFRADQLPTDRDLDMIRNLSHRRTSALIAEELNARGCTDTPVATEAFTIEDVGSFINNAGEAVVKLPWSSTGRGVLMLKAGDLGQYRSQIRGMIANQGSIMCEPRLKGMLDLAMLFTMTGGRAQYNGLSVFRNSASGSYAANILADQEELERICLSTLKNNAELERVRETLPEILESIIGPAYEGPLGVDMMVYDNDGTPALDAAVEMNLRNTMGHVALSFYRKYCRRGTRGEFRVLTARPEETAVIKGHRLESGTLCLNPGGGAFTFAATLE